MNQYLDLLRTPGVARIVASQLMARFPYGMLSIAVLLYIHERTGSYAASGVVLASCSIAQAIAGPFASRLMGVFSIRSVIAVDTAVSAVTLTIFALFSMHPAAYALLGFIIGLTLPPVQSAVRTIYPKMVPGSETTRLYSLDAIAQEFIWIAGPILATVLGAKIGGAWALAACVAFLVGGGFWFITSPELGEVKIPRSKRRFGAVLFNPAVAIITATGFLLVGLWSAIEAGVVTAFGEGNATGGLVLAISSVGSIIGGLTFGHTPIRPWTIARRLAIMTAGVALALFSLDFWWLTIALFVTGVGTAPALAALYSVVSSSVKFSETPEAYGWLSTGQLSGAALGAGIAGFMIDHVGPSGAIATGLVFGILAIAVPVLFVRKLPDLSHGDVSPRADTGAVSSVS